jgi:hypothetical protein
MVVSQPIVAPDADSKDADNSYVTGGNGLPIRCLVITSKSIGSPSPPELYTNALSGMNKTPSLMM